MSTPDKWEEVRKIATVVIQHFEGCHLTSYVLEGEKWATIGWGKAIPLEQHPKTITQAVADSLFQATLLSKEKCLRKEIPASVLDKLSIEALAALLSFRYNMRDDIWLDPKCNTRNALKAGTIKAFLAWHAKWINKGTKFEEGLTRRRKVERVLIEGKKLGDVKAQNWYI